MCDCCDKSCQTCRESLVQMCATLCCVGQLNRKDESVRVVSNTAARGHPKEKSSTYGGCCFNEDGVRASLLTDNDESDLRVADTVVSSQPQSFNGESVVESQPKKTSSIPSEKKKEIALEQQDTLERELSDLTKKNAQLEDLRTHQLSKQMQYKLAEDESALENINSKNRPSEIDRCYLELMTSAWLDAKDELDEGCPGKSEEWKTKLLCEIVMMAYEDAQDYLPRFRAMIQSKLINPLQDCSSEDDTIPGLGDFDQGELGLDLRAALGQFLKERSDKVKTDAMCEKLWSHFETQAPEKVKIYLNEVCRLVWRMVVQKPPMEFVIPDLDQQPSNDKHEIYYDGDIVNRDAQYVISSYVYPILTQKGKVLRKGKVFVKPEVEVVQDNVAATSVSSECKTSDIQEEEIDKSPENQAAVIAEEKVEDKSLINMATEIHEKQAENVSQENQGPDIHRKQADNPSPDNQATGIQDEKTSF